MNLRSRLTLFSSIIFGVIFSVAALVIYFTFYKSTERSVIKELEKTCLISAIFYLEKDEQPSYQHKEVKRQFDKVIHSNMVAIYDENDKVQFGDLHNDRNITESRLKQLKKQHKLYFQSNNHFYYGMYYLDNQGDFYVFIKEKSADFQDTMRRLLIILVMVLLVGWTSIIILSKLLSKIAYKPLKQIVKEIKNKESNTLTTPVSPINTRDELQELVETYNHLLNRIADTFVIQRNFINYVSHEFRTPLAAISGTLEVYSQKLRSPEEYQEATRVAQENIEELKTILNNMLLLAEAKNTIQTFTSLRIDEILWDVVSQAQIKYKALIHVDLQVQSPEKLQVKGNEVLLQIALLNLVENGIKYSGNQPVRIRLLVIASQLTIEIEDQGIGILEEDLPFIQQTFFRGKNTAAFKGSGVGLSLAVIIFKQHQISFQIRSVEKGTLVQLIFPVF